MLFRSMRRLRPTTGIARRLTVPILYLHGADDGCIAPSAARGAERYFAAEYKAEVVECAGHFLAAECPDEIAARTDAWIRGR